MNNLIWIKDSIFGDIKLDKDQQKIVNDPNFQRLRYIKQTGFLYLVYPGANHTRFEHSIGTMNLTKDICERLNLEKEELILSGLLHDIGHTPFSHQSEELVEKYLHKNHEQIGEEIISKSSIRDKISESSPSFKKILSYLRGNKEGKIVTGSIGSDRLPNARFLLYWSGLWHHRIRKIKKQNILKKYHSSNI